MTQGETRAVDLTKTRGAAGDFGHQGRFVKTHLADTLAKVFVPL